MKDCSILRKATPWAHPVQEDLYLRGKDLRRADTTTVQFMHGAAFCGSAYWPLLKELSSDYGLFIQDMQGHGESDPGSEFTGWQRAVENATSVMDAFDLHAEKGPFIGMGHSYGASLSLIMAAADPTRFSGLVLLDPMIFPLSLFELFANPENPMVSRVLKKVTEWSSRDEAMAYLKSKQAFKTWRQDALESFIDHAMETHENGRVSLRCPVEVEAQLLSKPLLSIWDSVDQLKTPTVILYSNEAASPIGQSCVDASEKNPYIQSIPVDGSHNFMQEFPDETLVATREALAQLLS